MIVRLTDEELCVDWNAWREQVQITNDADARTAALDVPGVPPDSPRNGTAGTSM